MVTTSEERQRIKVSHRGALGSGACSQRGADTHKMKDAANDMRRKLPAPNVSELIQYFNGDKYKVAYELTRNKLGREGTPEQYKKEYQNMLDDINRYLKKTRTPSTAMKQRFKNLYLPESDKPLQIHIRGCVNVSSKFYYKTSTWNTPIVIPAKDVNTFLQRASQDNSEGYGLMNMYYMGVQNSDAYEKFTWLDNTEINMSF